MTVAESMLKADHSPPSRLAAVRTALRKRPFLILGLAFLAALLLSLFIGRYPAPYWMSPSTLWEDTMARQLVFNLRLPRILTACLLGMTLAACGTVLQMIFRNPLVEPGFLGVSQGAAFGAAFSIIFLGSAHFFTESLAALFACLGLALSYFLARRVRYGGWILRLVLSGIAVSALFASGVGVLKYLADPLTQLPDIVFWMLGGLWGVTWTDFLYLVVPVSVSLVIVYLMRWRLNLLSLDDDTGFSLGAAPGRERTLVLVAAVVATAAGDSGGRDHGHPGAERIGQDDAAAPAAGCAPSHGGHDPAGGPPPGQLFPPGAQPIGRTGAPGRAHSL